MCIRTIQLGLTGLDITVLGFGAWAIGGQWEYGWGEQDDDDSIATMRAAIEKGINWIDTAPAYGLGHSEELIGRMLKELPASEKPLIFTKCGLIWNESTGKVLSDISPVSIRREVETSLRRLKVDVIDLYQIHLPVPDTEIEAAWETMADLKKTGKVRHIGVSNFRFLSWSVLHPSLRWRPSNRNIHCLPEILKRRFFPGALYTIRALSAIHPWARECSAVK